MSPRNLQDLRLRQFRARRAHLAARLRRIRELEAANRLLREQLLFLQQLLEENQRIRKGKQMETRIRQENNGFLS